MSKKLRWRYGRSTGYWYFTDGNYDYGHVFPCGNPPNKHKYGASAADMFVTTKTLAEAKRKVEQSLKKGSRK